MLFAWAIASFYGCDSEGLQPSCPAPLYWPALDIKPVLSFDRKYLAYVNEASYRFYILDLQTGVEYEYYDFAKILPDTPKAFFCGYVYWSPYSPNKLFFYGNGFYDTLNDGHIITRFNHYFYDLDSNKVFRITPSKFGRGSSSGFGIAAWLKGSTNECDSLLGGVGTIYIPQKDTFIQSSIATDGYRSQSPVSSDEIQVRFYNTYLVTLFLNGTTLLNFSSEIQDLYKISWSRDGKKIILSLRWVNEQYAETLIFDLEKFRASNNQEASTTIVDIPRKNCMYTQGGYAEFITDSTIAISMYHFDDNFAPLWETTLDGKIIRQLTFP